MSFQTKLANSSRVTKSRKPSRNDLIRHSTSSPSPRKKQSASNSTASNQDEERLYDTGVIASLADDLNFRDVPQYMEYIRSRMFNEIPEKAPGMNSTKIAEILNYRAALPPAVTVAHVNALSRSSTKTEREIAQLAHAGVIRKIAIPNRGIGAAAVGEGLVLVAEWERLVQNHPDLDAEVKAKYISRLKENPTSITISSLEFTSSDIAALTAAGFLTSSTASDSRSALFATPGTSSLGSLASLSTAGSKNASGSLAAVGGSEAPNHISGGGGGQRGSHPHPQARYNFSLPNTGPYLKLLTEARAHLLGMLKKSKFREAPMETLHERWDGGVVADDAQSQARKARGEFAGVLPGRTKKWRSFYGMRFEWILEECLGSGLVEVFGTGSVGIGVRAI